MATLYITEYSKLAYAYGGVPVPVEPAIAEQTVAIGGTSTQSNTFNAATRFVVLSTDAICSVKFGSNPTATTSTRRLADESSHLLAVEPGHKVAVITNS